MRFFLITFFSIVSSLAYSQALIVDSSFLEFGKYIDSSNVYGWSHASCSRGGIMKSFAGENESELEFQFRVSSVAVDPNYIIAKMTQEMQAGTSYRVSISVRKSRFSSLSLREIQVYFGASKNESVSFLHGMSDHQLLKFDLDSVKSDQYITLTMQYTAQGGEEYVYLGSLAQRFTIAESTKMGLMMADRTYQELPFNCLYYVDYISLIKVSDEHDQMMNSLIQNTYNIKSRYENLILNGGAETDLKKRYFTNAQTPNSSGSLIAPYVYSLTHFSPEIHQLDSNDYRSEYDVNQLCYMGDGQFMLDALHTNVYHTYQAVREKVEGEEYDTYYIYEQAPYLQILPYAYGEYLVFNLKEPLQKGIDYNWSSMIKLNEQGSFGVPFLGVHFLDSFPENQFDSLWQRSPDIIVDVKHLTLTQAWNELNYNYLAKGNEKYVVIGHLPQLEGVISNQKFKRPYYNDCGPHTYNCVDRYVYFSDSLFARYQLDNMVLIESDQANELSVVFEAGKRVQLEVIFTEMLKDEEKETNLVQIQNLLINAQQVLRAEDAICIVDLHKSEPVTLEPNPIINKKKIIRKIGKPKTVKKLKTGAIPLGLVLFGDGVDDVNLNFLVIVTDESLDLDLIQERLNKFMLNGGSVIIFFTGDPSSFKRLKEKYELLGSIEWILAQDAKPEHLSELLILAP